MKIREATLRDVPQIADLVMIAMTDECCLNLSGEGKTLDDFRRMMLRLVAEDHSQYSWRNALMAVDEDDNVLGAVVSYDGGQLYALREAFIRAAREMLNIDHSGMPDETQPGEWYIDSLAVYPQYRRQGIAHALLDAASERARKAGLPAALLVDEGNPRAERLYSSVGFMYVDDAVWGGHAMRHLRRP